jgi:DDE superfamily endonuclease
VKVPVGPAVEAKGLTATERDEHARARWRERMRTVDPAWLVFVEECGTPTAMTRRRARVVRGVRAHGAVPRNCGPVTTLLTGLSLAGMSPAMTVEGEHHRGGVRHLPRPPAGPQPAPWASGVVDNVGAHKPKRMRQLVEAAGCQLIFLPASSPDLSPVEEAFSKIKTRVRAAGARTHAAIATALKAVTLDDAAGWFTHAGYAPQLT